MTGDGAARPVLRVISGDATPEEVAAVLAVLVARAAPTPASGTGSGDGATTSVWADHAAAVRRSRELPAPGPHTWRTSTWPG